MYKFAKDYKYIYTHTQNTYIFVKSEEKLNEFYDFFCRLLVFGAGNHELEFIGCLTYCLLQLTADIKIMLDTNMKTTWHVNPQVESSDDRLMSHQGHNLMAVAATRVWEELYVCKKPAIEEVFKVTLSAPVGNERAPELPIVREQVHEAASKLWLNYVVSERRASYRVPWELHNQIQSVR